MLIILPVLKLRSRQGEQCLPSSFYWVRHLNALPFHLDASKDIRKLIFGQSGPPGSGKTETISRLMLDGHFANVAYITPESIGIDWTKESPAVVACLMASKIAVLRHDHRLIVVDGFPSSTEQYREILHVSIHTYCLFKPR
jgi:hypothetical protein